MGSAEEEISAEEEMSAEEEVASADETASEDENDAEDDGTVGLISDCVVTTVARTQKQWIM